jgi:hypothetical protein
MSSVEASRLLQTPLPSGWSIGFDPLLRQGFYLCETRTTSSIDLGIFQATASWLHLTYSVEQSRTGEDRRFLVELIEDETRLKRNQQDITPSSKPDWRVLEFDIETLKDTLFIIRINKLGTWQPYAKFSALLFFFNK